MRSSTKRLNIGGGVKAIRNGEVIVYPTESVYGFGCDPMQPKAIEKIVFLKKRGKNKGFILIISDVSQLAPYVEWGKIPDKKWEMVTRSWPGPVTWVLPARASVNPLLLGPHQTIAIRMSNHPVAKSLCEAIGGALVSTSVNISEQNPLVQPEAIESYFFDDIAGIVEGSLGQDDKPSWVIDFASQKVLRSGSDKRIVQNLGVIL